MIETLEPTSTLLVVIDLMLSTTPFALGLPLPEKLGLVDYIAPFLRPGPQRLATSAVHHTQAAWLPDLLRELWDFR